LILNLKNCTFFLFFVILKKIKNNAYFFAFNNKKSVYKKERASPAVQLNWGSCPRKYFASFRKSSFCFIVSLRALGARALVNILRVFENRRFVL
jgi:hypothetical protein